MQPLRHIRADPGKAHNMRKDYINPYLAGVLLGFVLLASFVIAGRGIGASGAVSQTLAHAYETVGVTNNYLQQQKTNDSIWQTWIILELIGVFFGAWLSAPAAPACALGFPPRGFLRSPWRT